MEYVTGDEEFLRCAPVVFRGRSTEELRELRDDFVDFIDSTHGDGKMANLDRLFLAYTNAEIARRCVFTPDEDHGMGLYAS